MIPFPNVCNGLRVSSDLKNETMLSSDMTIRLRPACFSNLPKIVEFQIICPLPDKLRGINLAIHWFIFWVYETSTHLFTCSSVVIDSSLFMSRTFNQFRCRRPKYWLAFPKSIRPNRTPLFDTGLSSEKLGQMGAWIKGGRGLIKIGPEGVWPAPAVGATP